MFIGDKCILRKRNLFALETLNKEGTLAIREGNGHFLHLCIAIIIVVLAFGFNFYYKYLMK